MFEDLNNSHESGFYWCKISISDKWIPCYCDKNNNFFYGFTQVYPTQIDKPITK